jgi:glycosyltransferase involved in cell wall biosynthesis
MSNNPLFSILIANYNNGRFIDEAIQSVFDQTYEDWEIIIVDDCSTDNSKEIYEKYNSNNKIKIYYNKSNQGCGFTKRRCAELANGYLSGFLDPDDVLLPNALELMLHAHLERDSSSLIYSKYIACDQNLNQTHECDRKIEISKGSDFLHENNGVTAFASFKKSKYDLTVGIDPTFKRAIDVDLYYKLEEVGDLTYIDKPLYLYRFHDGSISLNKNIFKAYYWHIKAIENACKRRNIEHETEIIVSNLMYSLVARYEVIIERLNKKLIHPTLKDVFKSIYRWLKNIK